jgi:serine/threonine protein kinase
MSSKGVQLHTGIELYSGHHLLELLGQGGFAQVWEAETKQGDKIALKFIPCRNDLSAAKEIRSIRAVGELKHAGLIRIEQVWIELGYIVVPMELADGSLLDLLLKYQNEAGTAIFPELVCVYLLQVAQVLDFLNTHQHPHQGQRLGFQHCDIKPSNLLLFDDVVKISDFGLSSATGALIKSHRRGGTMHYAAPEVFQSRLSDWTDQYALAVSYCQLRSGRLPFTDTPRSFRREYIRPAPDLSFLPEGERPIIARALAPIPQNRWPSCVELVNRLAFAIASVPSQSPSSDT